MRSGFGRGLSRSSVREEIDTRAVSSGTPSYTRLLSAIAANASSLTADQEAAINSVSLGDITDFTGTLNNLWPLPIPEEQRTGAYACTTYDFTSTGLQVTTSHDDTRWEGTNGAKSPGFWRMIQGSNFDIAVDLDNFQNQPTSAGAEWHAHLILAIGDTSINGTMLGVRLKCKQDGGGVTWQVARVISPSYTQGWDSGYVDEYTLSEAPTSVRLRIQHSVSDVGYKVYYSLDGGSTYNTIDETGRDVDGLTTGGSGWFTKLYTRNANPHSYGNRYSVGGPAYCLFTVGQNLSKTTAQGEQGSVRVKFKDLA